MNSEELEVSLRTEFESYLKSVFADVRQEISQIQEKIEAELENHKKQLETVFTGAMSRVEQDRSLDESFRESMVEHFRQAKDEGARITATAIAEAEELARQTTPAGGVKEIFEAVNDISTKLTQAEILKTLVQHAGQFTPRGAFFIIKNEHFVGWRTFGNEKGESDEAVREVFMPFSSDSILSEATRSLVSVASSYGTYSDDAAVLEKLGYEGSPDKMYAIPLVVRGRAVAVLYADYGTKGSEVNAEALETLVRVSSLTVELLASARGAAAPKEAKKKPTQSFTSESFAVETKESAQPEYATVPKYTAPVTEHSFKPSYESESFSQSSYEDRSTGAKDYSFDNYSQPKSVEETPSYTAPTYQPEEIQAPVQEKSSAYESPSWSATPAESETEVSAEDYATEINADDYSTKSFSTDYATQDYSAQNNVNEYSQSTPVETNANEYSQNFAFQMPVTEPEVSPKENDYSSAPVNDYKVETNQSSYEAPASNSYDFSMPVPPPVESFTPPPPVNEQKYGSFEMPQAQPEAPKVEAPKAEEASFAQPAAEPVQQASTPPVKSRFSERNVDLPIEVSEDERRLHNDARRFARLLVSEIKLYNEQKVKEGRDAGDLYDRLREAVDRSREMYDKRVQPTVAAKFDYFHYELVNTLAEGDETRLGSDYPGASV